MRTYRLWQRSCFNGQHNLEICGERELRGERRGKGGRSLFVTAAPSFFIYALFSALPSSVLAQVRVEAKIGAVSSTALVTDRIATPGLRSLLGQSVETGATAKLALAPTIGIGAAVPLRGATEGTLMLSWSGSRLRASEEGRSGSRDIQSVSVFEGIVGVRGMVRPPFLLSGGFGAILFSSEDRALFAGGSSIAPLLDGGLGSSLELGGHRVHVRAFGRVHPFNTTAMQNAGSSGGNVARFGLEAILGWKAGAR